MLLLYISLNFPSQRLKFDKFATASLFSLSVCPVSSTIFSSYLRGYPSNRRGRPTGIEGLCLSADSLIKEIIKLKFSCTERLSEYPLKYLSFAKSDASFLTESKLHFWYKNNFLREVLFANILPKLIPSCFPIHSRAYAECSYG